MSSMVKKRRQGPCPCCVGSLPSRCFKPENWWPVWRRNDGGGFWGEDDYDPNEHQTWVQFVNGQMVVVDGPCGCVDCQQKNKEAA